jgi:predicted metal-dependent peptidase
MRLIFAIDESCMTAATDGVRIFFGPRFLETLSDDELDFVMMHELLHVVLFHCLRGKDLEHERFNIACDIVVNSNIMLERGLTRPIELGDHGAVMHLAPKGQEGHLFTAEEVYEMLPRSITKNETPESSGFEKGRAEHKQGKAGNDLFSDDHSRWGTAIEDDDVLRDVWVKNILDASEAVSIQNSVKNRGRLPLFAERLIGKLKSPQTDWRTILNDFVQEEINDYSFTPPDRRFDDTPFFLPDFNEKEDMVKNILFMIDTSGSMSDDEITAAFSEVYGAVSLFGGKLAGKLGFFDAAIIEPIHFENVRELRNIRAAGGGGTDFQIIFEYVAIYMQDDMPASIIILTDGYAPFPQQKLTMGIPVLRLINNEDVHPPWGKTARIKVNAE